MPGILQYATAPLLGVVYFLAIIILFRRSILREHPDLYRLFKYGLFLKLISSFLVEIVYIHYYGYGDTLVYYREATFFINQLIEQPQDFIHLFNLTPEEYKIVFADIIKENSLMAYYNESTVRMIKISAFMSLFSFNSLFGIGMLYGSLCYIGLWYFFRVIAYHLKSINLKYLFAAIVFLPSVMFWGSGLLKEPIAIFLLCLIVYHLHKLVIRRKFNFVSILAVVLLVGLLAKLKSFYLIALYPSFILFVFFHYVNSIHSNLFRRSIKLLSLAFATLILLALPVILVTTGLDEKIMGSTIEYIISHNENLSSNSGSGYSLELSSPSLTSLVGAAPEAIVVTLFRPFLWESTKVVILISAIESFFITILTLIFIFKVGILTILRNFLKHPIFQFLFFFTIAFAIIVGVSSGNFGALVRYKIPCLPFYMAFVVGSILLKNARIEKKTSL